MPKERCQVSAVIKCWEEAKQKEEKKERRRKMKCGK